METLGQYRILDRIGASGLGEVFRARDIRVGRTVAIRVLNPALAGDAALRRRFIDDARAAMVLSHPGIAALYEVGEDRGQVFAALEFVPGDTLQTLIAGRPLNPRRAADLGAQIADALAEAHACGILHRNLSPDTVVVTPKGSAKILDFAFGEWARGGPIRSGGSEAGSGAADHRSDLFSLGAILFEMLTGTPPSGGTAARRGPQQSPKSHAPVAHTSVAGVPLEFDAIVRRAMASDPEERYQSAAALAAELREVAAALERGAGTTRPPVTAPRSRRRRSVRWALALLTAAGLAALVWWAAQA